MDVSRRAFMGMLAMAGLARGTWAEPGREAPSGGRVPVIDITDLYHPPQDPGDNVDLIAAYALPEIDLRAVILDVTERYRRPYVNPDDLAYSDPLGGRDPGFIPVWQLNSIFGRNLPCAAAPFASMRDPEDTMEDAPAFQQHGVELLIQCLREACAPVVIVSFGSARPLAVACNREPELLRTRVREICLCMGSAPEGYLEWNVKLDPHAFVRVLRSGLPVSLYPCATPDGAFDLGKHNTYWLLPEFSLIRRVCPPLQRYLAYAFERSGRVDFLAVLEEDVSEERIAAIAARPHNVWETDVWLHVSGRKLAYRPGIGYRIFPEAQLRDSDRVVSSELLPCVLSVRHDGQFSFSFTEGPSPHRIFYRADPEEHQRAMREALPKWYAEFLRA